MRISDWSSDVCSSDLLLHAGFDRLRDLGVDVAEALHAGRPVHRYRQARVGNAKLARERCFRHAGHADHVAAVAHQTTNFSDRSEEHTSELQSLMRISYAVFCLKKKKPYRTHLIHTVTSTMIRTTNSDNHRN